MLRRVLPRNARDLIDRSRWLQVAIVAAPIVGALALCLYATKRGFDYTDEGLFLLSAQHPLEYLRSTSQSQLLWGPILDLVGSVQFLRIVKLIALSGSSVFFAVAFVRSFRLFAGKDCDRRDQWVCGAAVAAGGLMTYVWLPQTPGYNELTTIFTTVILGIVLWLWVGTNSRRTVQLAGFAIGVLACGLALAKWSGAIAVVPVALVAAVEKRISLRQALAWLRWVGGGVAVGLIAIHTTLAPLPDIVDGVRDGIDDVQHTHGVSLLWEDYPGDFVRLGEILVQDYWPALVLAVLIGLAFARRPSLRGAQVLSVLGIGAFGLFLVLRKWAEGGTFNLPHSSTIIPSLVVCVAIACVIGLRRRLRHLPLIRAAALLSLALVPFLASVGTNNTIQYTAMFMSGCFIAVILAMIAGSAGASGRLPLHAMAFVLVLLISYMVVDGTWRKPYQQAALSRATVVPALSDPVTDLTVAQEDATFLERVDEVVVDAGGRERINMIALWTIPGAVALVGAVQPTYGWLPRDDVDRAVRAIRVGCREEAKPLLVLVAAHRLPDEIRQSRDDRACEDRSWKSLESIQMVSSNFTGELLVWLAEPPTTR